MASTKTHKLCLLSFENRREVTHEYIDNLCAAMAACGYYFDKISRIAFDSSEEIVRAFNEGREYYDNLFILCPSGMTSTLKDFLGKLYGASFDALNMLACDGDNVFIINYDGENRLQNQDIKRVLDAKYGISYDKTYIRAAGAPREVIDGAVNCGKKVCCSKGGDVFFNVYEDFEDYRIEIAYSSMTPKILLDEILRAIVSAMHEFVYALEDVTLAQQLYRLLQLRRLKISVAESFTGGGICKKLVEVPGVSEVFFEGLNTYSNEAKIDRLGVTELTLKQRGAVSAETAYQMAEGLLNTGKCDVAISTTGIAGPKSDSTAKPVGLAFIGIGVGEDIAVYKFNFDGDRERITKTAINQALFLTYKRLK